MQEKNSYIFNVLNKISSYLNSSTYHNLTAGEYGVLWAIDNSEGKALHPSEVSRLIGIARPSLTPILRKLEGFGVIERVADSADGRKYLVATTEKCDLLREKQAAKQKELFNELMTGFEEQEFDEFIRLLHKIENTIDNRTRKNSDNS